MKKKLSIIITDEIQWLDAFQQAIEDRGWKKVRLGDKIYDTAKMVKVSFDDALKLTTIERLEYFLLEEKDNQLVLTPYIPDVSSIQPEED